MRCVSRPSRRKTNYSHALTVLKTQLRRFRFAAVKLVYKCTHCRIELLRTLQRSEVAHITKKDELCAWNGAGQIFCVLAFDEFVPLALRDPNGHTYLRKILRGVIRLRPLHQADIFHEVRELFRCS